MREEKRREEKRREEFRGEIRDFEVFKLIHSKLDGHEFHR